jgi:hypothetical protein
MELHYHIHVNVFEISKVSEIKLIEAGYFYDPFEPLESSYAPPNHYSWEGTNKKLMQRLWENGLEILKQDEQFKGYIECETLSEKFSIKYADSQIKKFQLTKPFPLPLFKTIEVPPNKHKQADLHVKRHKAMPRDELDTLMLASGFYEVWTPRSRIYTLQLESAVDAKALFLKLKDFFHVTGGIKQLNFEVIGNLIRFPNDFKMAKFLPKQEKSRNKGSTTVFNQS